MSPSASTVSIPQSNTVAGPAAANQRVMAAQSHDSDILIASSPIRSKKAKVVLSGSDATHACYRSSLPATPAANGPMTRAFNSPAPGGLDPKYLVATPHAGSSSPTDSIDTPEHDELTNHSTDSDNDNSVCGKKRSFMEVEHDECLFSPTFEFTTDDRPEAESSTVADDSPRPTHPDQDMKSFVEAHTVVAVDIHAVSTTNITTTTTTSTVPTKESNPVPADNKSDDVAAVTAEPTPSTSVPTVDAAHNDAIVTISATHPVDEVVDVPAADVQDEQEETTSDDPPEFCPYAFIKSLPPYHEICQLDRPHVLPPKAEDAPRITLVLDLDETLVHCSTERLPGADMTFPVDFNGVQYTVYMRKRPFLDYFLHRLQGLFEIVVFTASQQVYADRLLDLLDPERRWVTHRVFRDACVNVEGNYLKDLSVLGRDLKTTVIVDNSPQAFAYHLSHGIPIESWFDDDADEELLKLLPFLETLSRTKDVRPWVTQKFKSMERVAKAGIY